MPYTPIDRRAPAWEKQAAARDRIIKRGTKGTGLLMDPGTGKTRATVEAVEELMRRDPSIRRILIISKITILSVWPENWHDWGTYQIPFVDLSKGTPRTLRRAMRYSECAPIVCLINYEKARMFGYSYVERKRKGKTVKVFEPTDTTLHDYEWDLIICDELHRACTPTAKITKFLLNKLKPLARYRIGLTGSAYDKTPMKLWALLQFISGDKYVPPGFPKYRETYAIPHPVFPQSNIGYKNLDQLADRLARCCVLVKQEEMYDLPEARDVPDYVYELPPKVRKIYNSIRDEQIAFLDELEESGGVVTAAHRLTVQKKLLQIASGFTRPDTDDGSVAPYVTLHTLVVDAVLDILDNREGRPTIVITQSNYLEQMLADAIHKKFKYRPEILNGSVKGAAARYEMVARGADADCLIVKESVGCEGLDMRYTDLLLWAEIAPNSSNYRQMRMRHHRGGQTKKVQWRIIRSDTQVHKRVLQILSSDAKTARAIEPDWRNLI